MSPDREPKLARAKLGDPLARPLYPFKNKRVINIGIIFRTNPTFN